MVFADLPPFRLAGALDRGRPVARREARRQPQHLVPARALLPCVPLPPPSPSRRARLLTRLLRAHTVLSVDIMDISGEHQNDVHHDLFKTRIGADGKFVEEAIKGKELTGDVERVARQKAEGYCASLRFSHSCRSSSARRRRELESSLPALTTLLSRPQAAPATAARLRPRARTRAAATRATTCARRTCGAAGALSTRTRSSSA